MHVVDLALKIEGSGLKLKIVTNSTLTLTQLSNTEHRIHNIECWIWRWSCDMSEPVQFSVQFSDRIYIIAVVMFVSESKGCWIWKIQYWSFHEFNLSSWKITQFRNFFTLHCLSLGKYANFTIAFLKWHFKVSLESNFYQFYYLALEFR